MIQNDEAIEVEIEMRVWGIQQPEDLLHPIREMKLDKYNDQVNKF